MKKIMTLIGLVFLVGFSIVFWTNYVNPCSKKDIIFVDTCQVDTNIVDTTKCQTDK
jgi:hypothetical protein